MGRSCLVILVIASFASSSALGQDESFHARTASSDLALRAGFSVGPSAVVTLPYLSKLTAPAGAELRVDAVVWDSLVVSAGVATEVVIPELVIVEFSSARSAARLSAAWRSSGRLRVIAGGTAVVGGNVPLLFIAAFLGLPIRLGSDVVYFVGPALDAQLGATMGLEYDVTEDVTLVFEVPLQLGLWWSLPIVGVYPALGVRFDLL